MKASPGGRSWIAAGVRHEMLTRALPALRHDMAAPVSVIRMALLLLKRQVTSGAAGSASSEERIGVIEDQLQSMVTAVRSLRHWELAASDEGVTRSDLVTQCCALMRAAFELNGIGLLVGDGLGPQEGEPTFAEGAALRYLFLGALGYLNDCAPHLGAIQIEADGPDAIRFVALNGKSAPADPMAGALRAPRKLAVDAIALHALADDLGHELLIEPDSVRIPLAQR
ncbi:MAG: hypothetical protein KKC79_12325 [Gammaproteobacteria bacterium]|nr:hypothetical protein [Gammaproteobacteria bacterium]